VLSDTQRRRLAGGFALPAIAAIGMAVLTACSSGTASSGGTAASDGTVHITVMRPSAATFEPEILAQQLGYFKAAGLTVTFKIAGDDLSQNVPPVLNGEVQFASADAASLLKAVAAGVPVRAVMGVQESTAAGTPSDGLLVPASSPIKSITDLKGKTVGVSDLGGLPQLTIEILAQKAGLNPADIHFVALPVTTLSSAAKSGKIDAFDTFGPFFAAAKAAGFRAIGRGSNDLPGAPQGLIFASASYLAAHADVAKKFQEAIGKGIAYADSHPAAVRDVDAKYTPLPKSYVETEPIPDYNTVLDKSVVTEIAKAMVTAGLISDVPPDSQFYWSQAPTN